MTISKSYGQFCPVARAAEIVAARWTPVLLRELLAGSTRFNDLRNGLPLMSPSLLSKRLAELEEAGIVRRRKSSRGRGFDYQITDSGKELAPIVMTLGIWGQKFIMKEFAKHELDPTLLMWDIQRRLDTGHFPESGSFVARFSLAGAPPERRDWWLIVKDRQVDLCVQSPGHKENLAVEASLKGLVEVWMGRLSVDEAKRKKLLTLNGEQKYIRSFKQWFLLSPFAEYHS